MIETQRKSAGNNTTVLIEMTFSLIFSSRNPSLSRICTKERRETWSLETRISSGKDTEMRNNTERDIFLFLFVLFISSWSSPSTQPLPKVIQARAQAVTQHAHSGRHPRKVHSRKSLARYRRNTKNKPSSIYGVHSSSVNKIIHERQSNTDGTLTRTLQGWEVNKDA